MDATLVRCPLFRDFDATALAQLTPLAQSQSLQSGEYLFRLGDAADRFYVVRAGSFELCFPFLFDGAARDIPVEHAAVGDPVGWSAFVNPYRFTLSARAGEAAEVAAFDRGAIQQVFQADPRIGYRFMWQVAQIVGARLLSMQALWARELHRAMTGGSNT